MAKEDTQISDTDKITIALINEAKTIPELYAFQIDGRSKAVDDAINVRGTFLDAETKKAHDAAKDTGEITSEEDHEAPLTIVAPYAYAYYDDDGALHSWHLSTKLTKEDADNITIALINEVNWATYEG